MIPRPTPSCSPGDGATTSRRRVPASRSRRLAITRRSWRLQLAAAHGRRHALLPRVPAQPHYPRSAAPSVPEQHGAASRRRRRRLFHSPLRPHPPLETIAEAAASGSWPRPRLRLLHDPAAEESGTPQVVTGHGWCHHAQPRGPGSRPAPEQIRERMGEPYRTPPRPFLPRGQPVITGRGWWNPTKWPRRFASLPRRRTDRFTPPPSHQPAIIAARVWTDDRVSFCRHPIRGRISPGDLRPPSRT